MSKHDCPWCGDYLLRQTVVNVRTNEDMGHLWYCGDCGQKFIGWGESGEYDGTPKPMPAAKATSGEGS